MNVGSAIRWSAGSNWVRQALQGLTTVVMAQLLAPSDFGVVAMVMVLVGLVEMVKDLGTSAAVIQHRDCSERFLSTLFWLNAAFGALAAVFFFVLAPAIAHFYREPKVEAVLRLLSLTFCASGLGVIPQALLTRRLAFSTLGRIEIFSSLIASLVGILSAFLGAGLWSLAWGSLASTLAATALLWISHPWRPAWAFDWPLLRRVGGYSINLVGFNLVNYFSRNVDNLLIGRYLGSQSLGYYDLAYRLMLLPLSSVSRVIARVAFPVFSRLQDDKAGLQDAYLGMVGVVALFAFPMALGLALMSHPLVMVLFGSQWAPVILLLKILSPVGMVQSVAVLNGAVYGAKGATGSQFAWGSVFTLMMTMAFLCGLPWGINGVAAAYALVVAMIILPCLSVPLGLMGLKLRQLLYSLWKILASSLVMAIVLLILTLVLPPGLSPTATLGLLFMLGTGAYLSALWVINRDGLSTAMKLLTQ